MKFRIWEIRYDVRRGQQEIARLSSLETSNPAPFSYKNVSEARKIGTRSGQTVCYFVLEKKLTNVRLLKKRHACQDDRRSQSTE